MAARVENQDVLDIMDLDPDSDLEPFINVAHILVEKKLIGKGMDEDLLTEIERWLSAHFASIKSPRIMDESIGDASQKKEGIVFLGQKKGLDTTPYGQQVLVLDTSGTLAQMGKNPAMIEVIDFKEAT